MPTKLTDDAANGVGFQISPELPVPGDERHPHTGASKVPMAEFDDLIRIFLPYGGRRGAKAQQSSGCDCANQVAELHMTSCERARARTCGAKRADC